MRTRREPADAGFTLVEVLASLAVISVVLAATTTFFIRAMSTIHLQGVRQAAIQVASDGMEQLRAVPGAHALAWVTARATPATVTTNGVAYERSWTCAADGGACTGASLLIEPTVTVTWRAKGCTADHCSYVTSTRISTALIEPMFPAAGA
jgi:prepilin-type N-terminal cleavage/methylation domain-containing protein